MAQIISLFFNLSFNSCSINSNYSLYPKSKFQLKYCFLKIRFKLNLSNESNRLLEVLLSKSLNTELPTHFATKVYFEKRSTDCKDSDYCDQSELVETKVEKVEKEK